MQSLLFVFKLLSPFYIKHTYMTDQGGKFHLVEQMTCLCGRLSKKPYLSIYFSKKIVKKAIENILWYF